jgi:methionyl-tRNA formyltransferase
MTTKIVFLLAQSARSVAYVQAASRAKINIVCAVMYGDTQLNVTSSRNLDDHSSGLFCPDFTLDLQQSLAMTEWPVWHCDSRLLENETLLDKLKSLTPDLIVYSGYGGQIVPKLLLDIAPILHIHSGLLPDFPGSTTIYYQILEQRSCGASALLLDETIDTGPVLAKKSYPMPTKFMDIDYLYDNMIRADLLVNVLTNIKNYSLVALGNKPTAKAAPYFVIHPLLKHIAILSSDIESGQQGHEID